MTAAVLGVVGVVLGLVIGSGYQFWAVRRTELATALLALTVLADDLQDLSTPRERVVEHWNAARAALVVQLRPDDVEAVSRTARRLLREGDPEVRRSAAVELRAQIDALVAFFWEEFSAPIVKPVADAVLRRTTSERASEALAAARPAR